LCWCLDPKQANELHYKDTEWNVWQLLYWCSGITGAKHKIYCIVLLLLLLAQRSHSYRHGWPNYTLKEPLRQDERNFGLGQFEMSAPYILVYVKQGINIRQTLWKIIFTTQKQRDKVGVFHHLFSASLSFYPEYIHLWCSTKKLQNFKLIFSPCRSVYASDSLRITYSGPSNTFS